MIAAVLTESEQNQLEDVEAGFVPNKDFISVPAADLCVCSSLKADFLLALMDHVSLQGRLTCLLMEVTALGCSAAAAD